MKIGMIGLAGAGKDTVAEWLEYDYGYRRERFAEPLKVAAACVFGPGFDDRDKKEVAVQMTPQMEMAAWAQLGYMTRIMDFSMAELSVAYREHKRMLDNIKDMFSGKCSPRQYQQWLGTDVIRRARDSAFVDLVAGAEGDIVVVDCRFENELSALDICIFVDRDVPDVATHPSEKLAHDILGVAKCIGGENLRCYWTGPKTGHEVRYLDNRGTLIDTRKNLDELMKEFK